MENDCNEDMIHHGDLVRLRDGRTGQVFGRYSLEARAAYNKYDGPTGNVEQYPYVVVVNGEVVNTYAPDGRTRVERTRFPSDMDVHHVVCNATKPEVWRVHTPHCATGGLVRVEEKVIRTKSIVPGVYGDLTVKTGMSGLGTLHFNSIAVVDDPHTRSRLSDLIRQLQEIRNGLDA